MPQSFLHHTQGIRLGFCGDCNQTGRMQAKSRKTGRVQAGIRTAPQNSPLQARRDRGHEGRGGGKTRGVFTGDFMQGRNRQAALWPGAIKLRHPKRQRGQSSAAGPIFKPF